MNIGQNLVIQSMFAAAARNNNATAQTAAQQKTPVAGDEFETADKLSPTATTALNIATGVAIAGLGVLAIVESPFALWFMLPVMLGRAQLTS